jgi:hypothetical protein
MPWILSIVLGVMFPELALEQTSAGFPAPIHLHGEADDGASLPENKHYDGQDDANAEQQEHCITEN